MLAYHAFSSIRPEYHEVQHEVFLFFIEIDIIGRKVGNHWTMSMLIPGVDY